MSAFLKNFGLLAVALAVCLGITEMAARLLFADTVRFNRFHSVVAYDEIVTRRLQPNTEFVHTSRDGAWRFRINGQGFRASRDFAYEKPENVMRVLVVGDSHTQGMEVGQEETFAHRLDGRTCQSRTIETLNAGISGSGTSEQWIFYQREGHKYAPDAVVLGFFANDFDNNLTGFHALDEEGELYLERTIHPASSGTRVLEAHNRVGPLSYLSQNSVLYSVLMNAGWNFGKRWVYGRHLEENVFATEQSDSEREQLKVTITHRLLDAFKAETAGRDSDFLVLDIPQILRSDDRGETMVSSLRAYPVPEAAAWADDVIALDNPDLDLVVPNGQRHINARAHAGFAEAIYERLCGPDTDGGISSWPAWRLRLDRQG
ncbi:MAG: hypothetical protein AAGF59_09610 [Pseudomonadota bacterium]